MTPTPDLSGQRIAIVLLSAIGDVVHGLPVINSLKAAAPDCRITWIIQPGPHGLVADHRAIDEFLLFDRKQGMRAYRRLRDAVRGRRWDLVIALQVYLKAGLITALLPARRKLGFDRRRARDLNWLFTTERIAARSTQHVQDQYFEFLHHLGVPPRLEWGLESTPEEQDRYDGLLPPVEGPTAALVLGTSNPDKDWPAVQYAELVRRMRAAGIRPVLVGGLSERENAVAAALPNVLDLRAWDLRRLVRLVEQADVLVSPDTGPMHIGVALNTPTVGLLGYTSPLYCGPYRRFTELAVDAWTAPGEAPSARREFRGGRMEAITVEQVMDRVGLALERYPRSVRSGHDAP